MADAQLVQVAEAVKAAIVAHDFGIAFECNRCYPDLDEKLKNAGKLRVDLVPFGHPVSELASRGSTSYRCTVQIVTRKRFDFGDQQVDSGRIEPAEIDRLILLEEQIHEFLCHEDQRELRANMNWQAMKITDTYLTKHLREMQQFTGLMLVTYDTMKAL